MHTRLGMYKHFRGAFYHVIGVAINATNGGNPEESLVVYRAAEGKRDLFVRLEKEFNEIVGNDEETGQPVLRFGFVPKSDGV